MSDFLRDVLIDRALRMAGARKTPETIGLDESYGPPAPSEPKKLYYVYDNTGVKRQASENDWDSAPYDPWQDRDVYPWPDKTSPMEPSQGAVTDAMRALPESVQPYAAMPAIVAGIPEMIVGATKSKLNQIFPEPKPRPPTGDAELDARIADLHASYGWPRTIVKTIAAPMVVPIAVGEGLYRVAKDAWGALSDDLEGRAPLNKQDMAGRVFDLTSVVPFATAATGAAGLAAASSREAGMAALARASEAGRQKNMTPFYGEDVGSSGRIADPGAEINRLGLRSGLPDAPVEGFFNPATAALLQSGVSPRQTVAYYKKQLGSRGGKLPPGQLDAILKDKNPGTVIDRDWLVQEIDKRTPELSNYKYHDPDEVMIDPDFDPDTSDISPAQYKDWATKGPFSNYTETAVGYPEPKPRATTGFNDLPLRPNEVAPFTDTHFDHPNIEGWYRTQDTPYRTAGGKPVDGSNATRILEEVQPQRYQKIRDQGQGVGQDQLNAWGKERDDITKGMNETFEQAITDFGIQPSESPRRAQRYLEAEASIRRIADGVGAQSGQQMQAQQMLKRIRIDQDRYNHLGSQIEAAKKGVNPSPYTHDVNDATGFLLKNALRDASADNIDRMAWTPGDVQAERYDQVLRNVKALRYDRDRENLIIDRGRGYEGLGHVGRDKLADMVGYDVAERLLHADAPRVADLPSMNVSEIKFPEGMTIGGEGMRGFYGDGTSPGILGTNLQSLLNRIGQESTVIDPAVVRPRGHVGRNTTTAYGTAPNDISYPSIRLDPKTRETIVKTGLPIYINPKEAASLALGLAAQRSREIDPRGFYSPSLEAAKKLAQNTGTVGQMKAQLLTAGAKPKELAAVGFDKAFPDPNVKVTRGEIEEFLRKNRVELGREVYGNSSTGKDASGEEFTGMHRYESYSTPGGIPGSYRENVTTLPNRELQAIEAKLADVDAQANAIKDGRVSGNPEMLSRRLDRLEAEGRALHEKASEVDRAMKYVSSHWPGITNPLLHYRTKDFIDSGNPLAASGGDRLSLPSNRVEAGSELIPIHRGESAHNRGGKYYSTDREWTRQFTQGGRDSEIKSHAIKASEVYDPPEHVYAGDPDAIDAVVAEARAKGFKAVRLSEAKGRAPGEGEPASIFVFNKTALRPFDSPSPQHGSGDLGPRANQPGARTDNKVRVLDELQSDWAQRARDQGTRSPEQVVELEAELQARYRAIEKITNDIAAKIGKPADEVAYMLRNGMEPDLAEAATEYRRLDNESADLHSKLRGAQRGVPSAPYIGSTSDWVDLGLKQALIDAAKDESVNRLAWTPGKVQAERYNLASQVKSVDYVRRGDGVIVYAYPERGGREPVTITAKTQKELADQVGADMAAQIYSKQFDGGSSGEATQGTIKNTDFTVGGEGMKSFYGDMKPEGYEPGILAHRLQKLVKSLDSEAKVETHRFESEPFETRTSGRKWEEFRYPSIPITDAMRKKIREDGLPMFVNPKDAVLPALGIAGERFAKESAITPGIVNALDDQAPKGITAYHGSPHDQVWGPKWDILMGQQYRIAEAGSDYSTMFDILSAKLAKASDVDPAMRSAMEAKIQELHEAMGPDGRRMAGIGDNAMDDPKGVIAYHGSPHDFDQFSLGKIGTGEGAQAYGHGLYFAENEGVARSYRDNLTRDVGHEVNFRGEPFDMTNEGLRHRFDGYVLGEDGNKALAAAARAYHKWPEGTAAQHQKVIDNFDLSDAQNSAAIGYLSEFIRRDPGRMYQVRINAEPEQFLDWDKPLSGQSERVRNVLGGLNRATANEERIAALEASIANGSAASPYAARKLIDSLRNKDVSAFTADTPGSRIVSALDPNAGAASQRLREAGISGIRYLDQGSRGAGEGSYNYTVFDDELIDILKKYSNPDNAALPAMSIAADRARASPAEGGREKKRASGGIVVDHDGDGAEQQAFDARVNQLRRDYEESRDLPLTDRFKFASNKDVRDIIMPRRSLPELLNEPAEIISDSGDWRPGFHETLTPMLESFNGLRNGDRSIPSGVDTSYGEFGPNAWPGRDVIRPEKLSADRVKIAHPERYFDERRMAIGGVARGWFGKK